MSQIRCFEWILCKTPDYDRFLFYSDGKPTIAVRFNREVYRHDQNMKLVEKEIKQKLWREIDPEEAKAKTL